MKRMLLIVAGIFLALSSNHLHAQTELTAEEEQWVAEAVNVIAQVESYQSCTYTSAFLDVIIYKEAGTEKEAYSITRIYGDEYQYTQVDGVDNLHGLMTTFDTIGTTETSLDAEMRLVDGTLYVKVSSLFEFEGDESLPADWFAVKDETELEMFPTLGLHSIVDNMQENEPVDFLTMNVFGIFDLDLNADERLILPDYVSRVTRSESTLTDGRSVTAISMIIDGEGLKAMLLDDLAPDDPYRIAIAEGFSDESGLVIMVSLDESGQLVQVAFVPAIAINGIALDFPESSASHYDLVYTGQIVITYNDINQPVTPITAP